MSPSVTAAVWDGVAFLIRHLGLALEPLAPAICQHHRKQVFETWDVILPLVLQAMVWSSTCQACLKRRRRTRRKVGHPCPRPTHRPTACEVLAGCSLHASSGERRAESPPRSSSWATQKLQSCGCQPLLWHLQPLEFQWAGRTGMRLKQEL